jgi:hypothetical protein
VPGVLHSAARVYAQAALKLGADPGREDRNALARVQYQKRAVGLLRTALELLPADQRPLYWRENVLPDAALAPIRSLPDFVQLTAGIEGRDR